MAGLLTADQLGSLEAGAINGTAHLLSGDASPDSIWVICHALGECATSGSSVGHVMQVCRAWRDYVASVKDELYGAILPRAFPRSKCISMVLERRCPAKVSREVLYRRHLEAQLALTPLQEHDWPGLRGKALLDPETAFTIELWVGSQPVLFAALKDMHGEKQPPESPLTSLLKDMHDKEDQFLKETKESQEFGNMQLTELATMYDSMNRQCGWDGLSVMIHASDGDEVVRLYRAPFLASFHDRYLFGSSLENPKLILVQDGLIGKLHDMRAIS